MNAKAYMALLLAVAPALAQPKAYLTNSTANLTTVLDTTTDVNLRTVPVGANPGPVAVSRDGARAYVGSTSSISVIDTSSDTIVATHMMSAAPTAIAVTLDGTSLYVGVAGAVQVVSAASGAVQATIPVAGTPGGIAITPDGAQAFVAAGSIHVINTATNTVTNSFAPNGGFAMGVAVHPQGNRIFANIFLNNVAGVVSIDRASLQVTKSVSIPFVPSHMGMTPDGSRLYLGGSISGFSCGTYICTFFEAFSVEVIDTYNMIWCGSIPLASQPFGIAVTPDRSDVYVALANSVAVIGTSAATMRLQIPVAAGANRIAMQPSNGPVTPYLIDAVNDNAAVPIASSGGTAVANVLANDRLGGFAATLSTVSLSLVSSTSSGFSLNLATGAAVVAAGTAQGPQSLIYRICELNAPANCDEATVSATIRAPYPIDAVDDSATSNTGRVAIPNVLANDRFNGLVATTATVNVTLVSSTTPSLTLSAAGAVSVLAGSPMGVQSLVYQICEKASPGNCDSATATVTVIPYAIDAVNDAGTTTRAGGVAVANVLANDTFAGAVATTSKVAVTLVSSTNASVTLSAAGAVNVAAGAAIGTHTLFYKICEIASPANCDSASVTVTVTAYKIDAVDDSARGSSKYANTPIASVLANDTFAGARATTPTVTLSKVALVPASSMIELNVSTGAVRVLGKTESGLYRLTYRICETANPANCDQATAMIDLSGR